MKLNKLYGVKGNVTPDYFDCKMMNDMTKELRDVILDAVSEAKELRYLLGHTRSVTTRYYIEQKMQLVKARIKATYRKYIETRSLAHQLTEAYLEALDHAGRMRYKVAA